MNNHEFQLQLVLSAIATGSRTLVEISQQSEGIYPLELKTLLDELALRGDIVLSASEYRLAAVSTKEGLHEASSKEILLPHPHPLDYDWRFTETTSQNLTKLIIGKSKVALLLGAPSVFVNIIRNRRIPFTTLVDFSRELVDYLCKCELPVCTNVVAHNLLSGVLWETEYKADFVFCDPPWYVEHYIAFLAQAAYTSCIGAFVSLSLLPVNTRPDAIQDRWKIIEFAHKLGLHIYTIENGIIEYETPEFESRSLHSAGIPTNGNWRKGDLLLFRKVHNPPKETLLEILSWVCNPILQEQQWTEVLVGRHKVKLRGPFDDYAVLPELVSIEENNIIPTVSRRYAGRSAVDLWFWDNRVFSVRGKAALLAALHILAGRVIPENLSYVSEENIQFALTLLKSEIGLTIDYDLSLGLQQESTLPILVSLQQELMDRDEPLSIDALIDMCRNFGLGGHLAILTQPYLDKIIAGEKTIESRFSKARIPPFKMIKSGDVLFLKESSGPILALVQVANVEFFGPLGPGEADSLIDKHKKGLAVEESFRQAKQESRYATLIYLGNVLPIKPISLTKTDRRAWIILSNDEEPARLF